MISASDAKTQNINSVTTETEIFLINLNILKNVNVGNNTVVVNNISNTEVNGTYVIGTPMSIVANTYYNVWQGITADNYKTYEMNKVIDYFTKLGYTINRKSDDMEHLYWQITW